MNTRLVLAVVAGVISMITLGAIPIQQLQLQSAEAIASGTSSNRANAPTAISGDNVYITWWTNKTGNDEVIFRASTDSGATFGNKTNLSNTTGAESQDVEIAAEGGTVAVTWWERNQTANEPVARISTDNGATFGPMLKLPTNGTLGEAPEEEAEEGE